MPLTRRNFVRCIIGGVARMGTHTATAKTIRPVIYDDHLEAFLHHEEFRATVRRFHALEHDYFGFPHWEDS